jgi:hypothetical protein
VREACSCYNAMMMRSYTPLDKAVKVLDEMIELGHLFEEITWLL